MLVHNYEVAGKGHTGRQEPKNLLEQMHMENLLENLLANAYELPIELNILVGGPLMVGQNGNLL